jgi:hypothetical protein
MQKREAHDSDSAAPASGAPATPRVSGEVPDGGPFAEHTPLPQSSTRMAEQTDAAGLPSERTDTLLSAGKPADRLELLLEDRLAVVDDTLAVFDERLRDLSARVAVLEQKKSIVAPEPRQKPWLWIAFLIALTVVFQLLHALK